MIRAILWAQLLSMRRRKGHAAGLLFAVFTGALYYGLFAFLGWTLMMLFSDANVVSDFTRLLVGVLLAIALYWQLAPVMSASMGASIDLQKLRGYPIPANQLFVVELALRAVNAFDVLLLVAGVTAGLWMNPMYGSPFAAMGAALFIAMNIVLSAGMRSWLERFFLRARFKEVFFFVVLAAILTGVKQPETLLQWAPSNAWWPWAAIGHVMLKQRPIAAAFISATWMVVALVFSRSQFERTLHRDDSAGRSVAAAKDRGFAETLFRSPGRWLPDPRAALVEKELRTLARIARFRMAYGMSCCFGILMLMVRGGSVGLSQYALPIAAVYGLLMLGQVTYWNSLGFDRSAAQGYFCWPIQFRDVLIAKNTAVLLLLAPQLLAVTMVAGAFRIPISAGKIAETLAVMGIAAMFWLGLGNICSVRLPRAMNPDKLNQMSNKLQALTILGAPVVLLPVVLAYWSRSLTGSSIVFAGILVVAAGLGVVFYRVALDSAVETALRNRESLLMELARADGPVSVG